MIARYEVCLVEHRQPVPIVTETAGPFSQPTATAYAAAFNAGRRRGGPLAVIRCIDQTAPRHLHASGQPTRLHAGKFILVPVS
jgi:hypothetical protein